MPRGKPSAVIPCKLSAETKSAIDAFAIALRNSAPTVGTHGLAPDVFWDSGIFRGAIEKIRGEQAASMEAKRSFISSILEWLKAREFISNWSIAGNADRHDYEVEMRDRRICAIEAKGCLDGNNTGIFERPANADEFVIWSLCQNAGADPGKNAWSGIHTRLSAEIVHRRTVVDGLIIWDPVCNTIGRRCPKIAAGPDRGTLIGSHEVPPPCIYLFPRTVPDPRNNQIPPVHCLPEVKFLAALQTAFGGLEDEITYVEIKAGMVGNSVARATTLTRAGLVVRESEMTKLKRAKS